MEEEATGVMDQDAMAHDALNEMFMSQGRDPDSGKEVEGSPYEDKANPEPGKEEKTVPEKGAQTEAPVKKAEPAKAEAPGFMKDFLGEDGNFDTKKFADFAFGDAPRITTPGKKEHPAAPGQSVAAAVQEPPKEPWKVRLEEERRYKEGLQTNLFSWKTAYAKALQEGRSAAEAEQFADYTVTQNMQNDIERFRYELAEKEEKSRYEKQQAEESEKTIRSKAETNAAMIVAQIKSSDPQGTYNQIMFDQKLGGKLLLNSFLFMNPDADRLPAAEFQKEFERWYYKAAAHPQYLNTLYEFSRNSIFPHVKQTMFDRIGAQKDLEARKRAAGVSPSPSGQQARSPSAKGKGDALDQFFGPHGFPDNAKLGEV